MKLRWLLLILHVITQASCSNHIHYNGHRVVRFVPVSEDQVKQLSTMYSADYLRLDFWRYPLRGEDVDVHVTPENEAEFIAWLTSEGIPYDIIIDDIERILASERDLKEESDRRRRLRRQREVDDVRADDDEEEDFFNHLPPSDQVYRWLDRLEADNIIVSQEVIGSTIEDRDIRIVKLSEDDTTFKPTIHIEIGIHGRDHIAIGSGLWLLKHMVTLYGSDHDVTDLLRRHDLYFIPIVNPDGYDYTHSTDRFWRKNRRRHPAANKTGDDLCNGVDLNRNFNYPFGGPGSTLKACSNSYRGVKAFSEPETFSLRQFFKSLRRKPTLALTIHSSSQMWLVPWCYNKDRPEDYEELVRVAKFATSAMSRVHGQTYKYGAIQDLQGYLSPGCLSDWMKGRMGVKYAYGLDVYPSAESNTSTSLLANATVIEACGQDIWAGIWAAVTAISSP